MIPEKSTVRFARPTDKLDEIKKQYVDGLGFKVLGEFADHNGFSGVIIGHDIHPYHLEFTHHIGVKVGRAPTKDNLIVFYIPDAGSWKNLCETMLRANFKLVESYNPYWDINGKTFEDVDGYRVVLQNG